MKNNNNINDGMDNFKKGFNDLKNKAVDKSREIQESEEYKDTLSKAKTKFSNIEKELNENEDVREVTAKFKKVNKKRLLIIALLAAFAIFLTYSVYMNMPVSNSEFGVNMTRKEEKQLKKRTSEKYNRLFNNQ